MTSIFISYASPDKTFALRLARSVELLGYSVWIDREEIWVGDSLVGTIGTGIDQATYLIVVLSRHTQTSGWVERELQIKHYEEITQKRSVILPVVIEDCVIPPFLRPKRFADFRLGYDVGFAQLATTLHMRSSLTIKRQHIEIEQSISPHIAGYNRYMIIIPSKLTDISVELGLPAVGKITGTWKPDNEEQNAAWELYIELITRVSIAELQPDEGILRESLSSLYHIFNITRDILRKYGPSVARPKDGSELSFGFLAIQILNLVLRPVLTKWHPLLLDYEHTRDVTSSTFEHERRWVRAEELRGVLNDARKVLTDYASVLAQVAGVPQLTDNT